MKKNFKTAVWLMAGVLMMSGCASVPRTQADDLADISFGAYTVAALGTQFALKDNPGLAPYFNVVLAHLDALLEAKNFDPLAFAAALDQLPIKELRSPEGRLLITTAAIVYQRYGKRIDLDNQVYAAAAMAGVRDGIRAGVEAGHWLPKD